MAMPQAIHWYGLDFRQNSGKIQEGNGFCYASINAQQVAFGQGVVVTGGYRSCPAMQRGATVTTALTHQLPFFGALISIALARTTEQRTQHCAHVMTHNPPLIQVGQRVTQTRGKHSTFGR